jgi:hypothetical protein
MKEHTLLIACATRWIIEIASNIFAWILNTKSGPGGRPYIKNRSPICSHFMHDVQRTHSNNRLGWFCGVVLTRDANSYPNLYLDVNCTNWTIVILACTCVCRADHHQNCSTCSTNRYRPDQTRRNQNSASAVEHTVAHKLPQKWEARSPI